MWVPDQAGVDVLEPLPPGVEVDVWSGTDLLPQSMDEVEFLVPPTAHRPVIPMLADMPGLRVVQLLSAGAEWIAGQVPDSAVLCNAKGAHTPATAEWVLAAILAVLRDFPRFHDAQRDADWRPHITDELVGKKVLILGYGDIGKAVEQRLGAFGCEIVRVARTARPGILAMHDMSAVLSDADIVVILLPMTEATRGLLGNAFLDGIKPGALLVNASRGGVLDTGALTDHLLRRRFLAALDSVDPEPLAGDHPLWRAPGLLITPHVAGSTHTLLTRSYKLVREQLERYVRGEALLNVVSDGY